MKMGRMSGRRSRLISSGRLGLEARAPLHLRRDVCDPQPQAIMLLCEKAVAKVHVDGVVRIIRVAGGRAAGDGMQHGE